MDTEELFGTSTPVLGMVHLQALPGAPDFGGSRSAIRDRARTDARKLAEIGFDGVIVENYGDRPYYPDDVPKHVVAEMTAMTQAIRNAVDVPVGVNVLRNDAEASLVVAASAGASFIRVNVHTGTRATDQGVLEGQAHETLRLRDRLDADVQILADVAVKHSAPIASHSMEQQIGDIVTRGMADGLIVSGPATGDAPQSNGLQTARSVLDELDEPVPLFVGSGVTGENIESLVAVADGAIVGTATKLGRKTTNPVDESRAARLLEFRS